MDRYRKAFMMDDAPFPGEEDFSKLLAESFRRWSRPRSPPIPDHVSRPSTKRSRVVSTNEYNDTPQQPKRLARGWAHRIGLISHATGSSYPVPAYSLPQTDNYLGQGPPYFGPPAQPQAFSQVFNHYSTCARCGVPLTPDRCAASPSPSYPGSVNTTRASTPTTNKKPISQSVRRDANIPSPSVAADQVTQIKELARSPKRYDIYQALHLNSTPPPIHKELSAHYPDHLPELLAFYAARARVFLQPEDTRPSDLAIVKSDFEAWAAVWGPLVAREDIENTKRSSTPLPRVLPLRQQRPARHAGFWTVGGGKRSSTPSDVDCALITDDEEPVSSHRSEEDGTCACGSSESSSAGEGRGRRRWGRGWSDGGGDSEDTASESEGSSTRAVFGDEDAEERRSEALFTRRWTSHQDGVVIEEIEDAEYAARGADVRREKSLTADDLADLFDRSPVEGQLTVLKNVNGVPVSYRLGGRSALFAELPVDGAREVAGPYEVAGAYGKAPVAAGRSGKEPDVEHAPGVDGQGVDGQGDDVQSNGTVVDGLSEDVTQVEDRGDDGQGDDGQGDDVQDNGTPVAGLSENVTQVEDAQSNGSPVIKLDGDGRPESPGSDTSSSRESYEFVSRGGSGGAQTHEEVDPDRAALISRICSRIRFRSAPR